MPTKDDTARLLADAHFRLDEGITRIFRIIGPDESSERDPVKLLEVNPMTTEAGVSPVGMTADPARGVFHTCVIVEITPGEYERLSEGQLQLPDGWRIGDELFPHHSASGILS